MKYDIDTDPSVFASLRLYVAGMISYWWLWLPAVVAALIASWNHL